jgi:signal transduction histidine kinase/ActR/RegA family two-component response regulator
MGEIDPPNHLETAADTAVSGAAAGDGAPEDGKPAAGGTGSSLLAHLHSLQDLQLALAHEGREEEILRVGTSSAVEIIGADCGVAIIDPAGGFAGLRYGWSEGRTLAQHDIEILSRSLSEALTRIREGKDERVLLAAEPSPGDPAWDEEPPAPIQSRGFASVLVMGIGIRAGRSGVLVLARHDPAPFSREKILLGEILALQLSIHIERVRHAQKAGMRMQREVESATRSLRERNQELAAITAVASAVAPSLDLDKQLESLLRKTIELTGHAAGAIFLVEEVEDGSEGLRLARGVGDPGFLESLRSETVSFGEGVPGRVRETGQPVVLPDLAAESDAGRGEDPSRGGFTSLIGVPLRARDRLVGVMQLLATEPRSYPQAEVDLARAIGDQVALSIQSCRLLSDMMRYSLDLEQRVEKLSREAERRETEDREPVPIPGGLVEGEIPAQLVQAQRMESIGTLAGGIAHDFNNIIGAILGYATHIKSLVTPDNPIHRQAQTIEEQSLRAAELTQQLLAFASGGDHVREPVDLNQAVVETASLLVKTIDPRITVETHTAPDLPAVNADPGQMKQILLNAAVNAKEALPDGGRITFETRLAHLDKAFVRSHPDLKAGDYVEVVVGDTGVGMRPEVIDRVFEPFFTTKPEGEGTGLGLSVVYGVVRDHHGHVSLASTIGVGTTVRIYLPVAGRSARRPAAAAARATAPPAVPAPTPAAPASAGPAISPAVVPRPPSVAAIPVSAAAADEDESGEEAGASDGGPAAVSPAPRVDGRILVVDDEESLRELACDILRTRGYDVIVARDGVDALDVYRREWGKVGLVLLDMVMPRLGGLETFRRLRGMDRGLRVLLCSGYSHSEQAQQAIKEGALGLLPKPFTMTELIAWVEKLLRRDPRSPSQPGPPPLKSRR